jgi:hypothetical protein
MQPLAYSDLTNRWHELRQIAPRNLAKMLVRCPTNPLLPVVSDGLHTHPPSAISKGLRVGKWRTGDPKDRNPGLFAPNAGRLCRKDSAAVNAVLENELTDLSEASRLALPIRFKDSKTNGNGDQCRYTRG